MPEQKTFVTVKIDEKEIQEKSKIYDTSKIDPDHKMFNYYTELNKAAFKLALDDPGKWQTKTMRFGTPDVTQ